MNGEFEGEGGTLGILAPLADRETYGTPDHITPRPWQIRSKRKFLAKLRARKGPGCFYLQNAGTGSGKTIWTAMTAAEALNSGEARRVVYVCPNREIRRKVRAQFREFNIHLATWDPRRHGAGEGEQHDGIVTTYQALINGREAQAKLCRRTPTLIIFDEIHHLGDGLAWGEACERAFGETAVGIIGMSGTPYRHDNRSIPFVEWEERLDGQVRCYRADDTYTLGQAINEGVCRKPVIHWFDGVDVKVRMPDRTSRVVNFDEGLPVPLANRRLAGAVRPGAVSRLKALRIAVDFCRRTGRKLIIFLGGDTSRKDSGGVRDAMEILPAELRSIGVDDRDMCVVVNEDPRSSERLANFEKGRAQILITVNMVSEGVDIPSLSCALFLTNITARSTTIQRIGRVVRGQGECHVFMFPDPRYKDVAELIENEIRYEIDTGRAADGGERGPQDGRSGDELPEETSLGLSCEEGGITVNGTYYPRSHVEKYRAVIANENLPEGMAFMSVLLPLIQRGMFGPLPEGGEA